MKLLELHTCPVWQDEDTGALSVGMEFRHRHPPVQSWATVAVIELSGERVNFVLNQALLPD